MNTLIGKSAKLKITRFTQSGAYFDAENEIEILLPKRYLTEHNKVGDLIDVFVYIDAQNRPIVSTIKPLIKRDEFAYLKCKDVTKHGAFMDWGLEAKDLFVPFKEQKTEFIEGGKYIVYCYFDENTQRLTATAKIAKHLDVVPPEYQVNEQVDVLITNVTDIGFNCIVNNAHFGLVYHDEIYETLTVGQKLQAFVKKIREDSKIDISITPLGVERFESKVPDILEFLKSNDGVMFVTDKSDPELIQRTFAMSKKTFKKAIGNLYKNQLIQILPDRIQLR
jgi:predicted RNA-binding protein (virulence factor B family)